MPGRRNTAVRPWNGVVVGFDGTDRGRCAVRWAAGQAVRHGCPLYVVQVVEPVTVMTPGWMPVDLSVEARDCVEGRLLGEVEECRREFPGLEVHPALHDGRTSSRLAEHAGYVDADLIVVGAPRYRGLARLVLGSTVDQLARTADRTVVTVRDPTPLQQASVLTGQSPVVVVLDDLDRCAATDAALDLAFDVANDEDTEVTIVHGGTNLPADLPVPVGRRGTGPAEPPVAVQLAINPWRERFPGVVVTADAPAGRPERAVLRHAEQARLVVVAQRRRGAARYAGASSVARAALRRAACSVALVGEAEQR